MQSWEEGRIGVGGSDAYVRGCTGESCKSVPSYRRVGMGIETCGSQVMVPMEVDEKRRLIERRGEGMW